MTPMTQMTLAAVRGPRRALALSAVIAAMLGTLAPLVAPPAAFEAPPAAGRPVA